MNVLFPTPVMPVTRMKTASGEDPDASIPVKAKKFLACSEIRLPTALASSISNALR
jgi:hypothetical protein